MLDLTGTCNYVVPSIILYLCLLVPLGRFRVETRERSFREVPDPCDAPGPHPCYLRPRGPPPRAGQGPQVWGHHKEAGPAGVQQCYSSINHRRVSPFRACKSTSTTEVLCAAQTRKDHSAYGAACKLMVLHVIRDRKLMDHMQAFVPA